MATLQAQQITAKQIIISGKVINENNEPVAYANVYLLNSIEGAMTSEDGKFSFTTKKTGEAELIVSMMGYEKGTIKLNLQQNKNIELDITLQSSTIITKEAVVTSSSFSSENEKGIVITAMDVMTTPGGTADIYQSLKTLPGLMQVSEGAELYVRGGDPSETITLVDGASLYHPFTYESSYGGLFSSINTASVKNMYFSSGGFSAKYGNALSGVLDLQTKDESPAKSLNIGLSLANGSFNAEIPFVENHSGLRIDARQTFTKPLFWVNGGLDRFVNMPSSKDINSVFNLKYSGTGRLKLFGLYSKDMMGVNVELPEYDGVFDGNSDNSLLVLSISDIIFKSTVIKSSLSYNQYNNYWKLGLLDLAKKDYVYKFRTDLESRFSSVVNLLYGFEAEYRESKFIGIIPQEDYDIRPEGGKETLNAKLAGNRIGFYAEAEIANFLGLNNFSIVPGIRSDIIPILNLQWFDPRFCTGYKLNDKWTFRFGWGIFHQHADPRLYSNTDGNPKLKPLRAVHYIFSADYKLNNLFGARLELYHKDYNNLPLEDSVLNYNNNGYGFADGVDFMIKGKTGNFEGWISYSFINTKRYWMDFEKYAPSSFDITHNFVMIVKYNITDAWQIGTNLKYATGRPYTEITGSEYHADYKVYEPVYDVKNSSRFPDYVRLDCRVTYLFQLFNKFFSVFYVEGLNILNISNLNSYNYSRDYSQRYDIKSYFGRRTVVFGTTINLN
jgi:hypothetical protein